MLKALMQGKNKEGKETNLVLFALSYANLDRLREGRPILIDNLNEQLPIDPTKPLTVLIAADETEKKVFDELQKRYTIASTTGDKSLIGG